MTRSILRILLGALLPIPLMVLIVTIICDLFYYNKDSDYIRLADSKGEHIALDFLWYLIPGVIYFGIPSLIYSGVLEWRRRNGKSYLPAGLGLGALLGLCVGYLVIPSPGQARFSDFAEGFVHFLGVTLALGVVIPALLGRIRTGNEHSEQFAAENLS